MLFCFNNLMTPSDSPCRGRTWETASDYMTPSNSRCRGRTWETASDYMTPSDSRCRGRTWGASAVAGGAQSRGDKPPPAPSQRGGCLLVRCEGGRLIC